MNMRVAGGTAKHHGNFDKSRVRRKRHVVDLKPEKRQERPVSLAFKFWAGAYALLTVAGLSLASAPAHSQTKISENVQQSRMPSAEHHVSPADMQTGSLLLVSDEESKFVEAPRVSSTFDIDVTGPVARTILSQTFKNPSDDWIEGIYVFPLPDNSAVDHLTMKIGERLVEGRIKPRKEARKLYEEAREDGRKASLMEQQRPNLFTNAVANIGPGESVTIRIEYQQTIARLDDQFTLRLPLVVAPRYNPAPRHPPILLDDRKSAAGDTALGWTNTQPVPDQPRTTPPIINPDEKAGANHVTLSIKLNPGFPLGEVESRYHEIVTSIEDDGSLNLSLKNETVPANRDFVLTWTGKAKSLPNVGLFTQQPENGSKLAGEHYLLAYITPPYELSKNYTVPDREVVFVLDQSGSMEGTSIVQAKASLVTALKKLGPQDHFQVIRFNDGMAKIFGRPMKADREQIDRAVGWVQQVRAEGGTEMAPAMREALIDSDPSSDRLRQVIFLTDGAIGNEQQLFEIVKSQKGRSRIFTVGIGSAPNSFFMSRAAEVGRGTFTHIGSTDEVQSKMSKLFEQLTNPVATDLKIELAGSSNAVMAPEYLPDLYRGEPIVVAVKADKLGTGLTLKGRLGNQPWTVSLDLSNAAPSKAIDKLWARRKIQQMEADRLLSDQYDAIDKDIETLGLKHHLVTRLTSLVAIDESPSRPDDKKQDSRKVPLNLPDGWEMQMGQEADQMMASPMAAAAPTKLKHQTSPQGTAPGTGAPQTLSVTPTKKLVDATPQAEANKPPQGDRYFIPAKPGHPNWIILAGIATLLLAGFLLALQQWRRMR